MKCSLYKLRIHEMKTIIRLKEKLWIFLERSAQVLVAFHQHLTVKDHRKTKHPIFLNKERKTFTSSTGKHFESNRIFISGSQHRWFWKMANESSSSFSSYGKRCCDYLNGTDVAWRKKYFTEVICRNLVAIACTNSIAVVPTILLNLLVIFAVATRRHLRSNTNVLLACMAVVDCFTGAIVQPMGIVQEVKNILGNRLVSCCLQKIHTAASAAVNFASINHLVVISIERYIAIRCPLRYPNIVTTQWIRNGVLLAWAFALFTTTQTTVSYAVENTAIYSDYLQAMRVTFIIAGVLYMAVIGYTNVYIFFQTRRHKRRIQFEQVTQQEAERLKKDHRAFHTLAIILGTMVLTMMPSFILILTSSLLNAIGTEPILTDILWKWAITFALLRSVLNPIIYCWRVNKLRRAFLEILHLKKSGRTPQGIPEIQTGRTEMKNHTSDNFVVTWKPDQGRETVLFSYCHLEVEETVRIEEADNASRSWYYRSKRLWYQDVYKTQTLNWFKLSSHSSENTVNKTVILQMLFVKFNKQEREIKSFYWNIAILRCKSSSINCNRVTLENAVKSFLFCQLSWWAIEQELKPEKISP